MLINVLEEINGKSRCKSRSLGAGHLLMANLG